MKVVVYALDKKLKPTKKVIGEFEVNEIKLSDRRKLHVLEKKRRVQSAQGVAVGTDISKTNINITIDEDAWGRFYEKIGALSGVPDSEFEKYSDGDIDTILLQIYEAWQPSEKK